MTPIKVLIPRDIAHIRVLPDNFDNENIKIRHENTDIAVVKDGPDTSINDMKICHVYHMVVGGARRTLYLP